MSQRALDRDAAKIVASNVRKLAGQLGKTVVAAATDTDARAHYFETEPTNSWSELPTNRKR